MKIVAMISALRPTAGFEDKLLTPVGGQPLIKRVYDSAVNTSRFSEVVVITDDAKVEQEIKSNNGNVILNKPCGDSSLECIAKAALATDADLLVYILGNIPFVQKTVIEKLIQQFEGTLNKEIEAASVVQKIHDVSKINDTHCVKALLDLRMFAIYFSRAPIPYLQNKQLAISHYEHFGIYAFRKELLLKMLGWPVSPLERVENIEGLRLIENGVRIKMVINPSHNVEINLPADVPVAEELMAKMGWG